MHERKHCMCYYLCMVFVADEPITEILWNSSISYWHNKIGDASGICMQLDLVDL